MKIKTLPYTTSTITVSFATALPSSISINQPHLRSVTDHVIELNSLKKYTGSEVIEFTNCNPGSIN